MTSTVRVKQRVAVVLAVLLAGVTALGLHQAGAAVQRATRNTEAMSLLNELAQSPSDVRATVSWLPDSPHAGRVMEPATRMAITDGYANAWSALDRANRGDAAAPIREYLSGPALQHLVDSLANRARQPSETVQLLHRLELRSYSVDGSVVALDVPVARALRRVADGPSELVERHIRAVMLLQDGNWRLHQLEVNELDPSATALRPTLTRPLSGVSSPTIDGGDHRWRAFNAAAAADELDVISSLGLDTVRVFVAGPEFGEVDVAHLSQFLDQAHASGIGVVVTLYDGSADHRPSAWTRDERYLDRLVRPIAAHPALVMWDVKNEPDRDDERSGGAPIVDAWLARVIGFVRERDSATPITIGWSNAAAATRLAPMLDVVAFHHFGKPARLAALVETLSLLVDKPIVLEEYGAAARRGRLRGSTPQLQARAVADLTRAADHLPLAGRIVWVLKDGASGPAAEESYGLLRRDGTARPAAEALRTPDAPITIPLGERLRSAPALLYLAAIVGALAAARWLLKRCDVLSIRRPAAEGSA